MDICDLLAGPCDCRHCNEPAALAFWDEEHSACSRFCARHAIEYGHLKVDLTKPAKEQERRERLPKIDLTNVRPFPIGSKNLKEHYNQTGFILFHMNGTADLGCVFNVDSRNQGAAKEVDELEFRLGRKIWRFIARESDIYEWLATVQ